MTEAAQPVRIFRKGLELKNEVAGELASHYHSALVDEVRSADYQWKAGRLHVHLAREFGFCYGVDRAVDYAYQTLRRFPERPIYLTGEIIHNPSVNHRLRSAGIRFLSDHGEHADALGPDDVVILPAFGVSISMLLRLQRRGCTLVDTTCGSVLNVWKNVRRYARDGFTAIIHGKAKHEETVATASQALQYPGGRALVVLDRDETELVCGFIRRGGDPAAFLARFADAASPGFDPRRDLQRVGLANQTTMLMSESLAIGEMIRQAVVDRYGDEEAESGRRYRAFDTICSATQDRQDAIETLLEEHHLDLMFVIGGYNSSNTRNLARLAARRVPTYHIAGAGDLLSSREVRHRPVSGPGPPSSAETRNAAWLPDLPVVSVGVTAGASTPDSTVGRVMDRLSALANGGRGG